MKKLMKGQITVFLSLVLVFILSVSCSLIELSRVITLKAKIARNADIAGYSLLAEYNPVLLENYDLFFIDGGYGNTGIDTSKMSQEVEKYVCADDALSNREILLSYGINDIGISGIITAQTDGGTYFRTQAENYMRQITGLNTLTDLLGLSENGKVCDESNNNLKDILDVTGNLGEIITDNTLVDGIFDTIGNFNLIDTVNIVLRNKSISSKSIEGRDLSSSTGSFKESEYKSGSISSTILFDEYIMKNFQNYICANEVVSQKTKNSHSKFSRVLDYETEYIIAGETSDRNNIKNVINRLIMLRSGFNYTYLKSDKVKSAEAYEMASVIAALAAGNVELIAIIQNVILYAWALKESTIDVKNLFDGKKVALLKTSSEWNTDLKNLKNYNDVGKYDKDDAKGLDYGDYLRLLLFMQKEGVKNLYCLDIIELNVKNCSGYENFRVGNCICSFDISYMAKANSAIYSLPFLRHGSSSYKFDVFKKCSYENVGG